MVVLGVVLVVLKKDLEEELEVQKKDLEEELGVPIISSPGGRSQAVGLSFTQAQGPKTYQNKEITSYLKKTPVEVLELVLVLVLEALIARMAMPIACV